MRARTRRVGVAVALVAVAVLGSSCSSRPNAVGPCHHVVAYPNDGGFVAAFDWDNDIHAYSEPVPLTVCIGGIGGDVVTLATPAGVVLDPTERPLGHGALDVFTFDVPVITPSGEGWRFTDPDQS